MPVPTLALRSECPGQAWCDELPTARSIALLEKSPFERLAEEQRYLQPLAIREPLFIIEDRKATKTQLISD